MIVNLKSFVNLPAKVVLLRRSDFAAFYQVVIENIYSPYSPTLKKETLLLMLVQI
jgi:hypothetical protein